jgi:peptidoglycan/xylan/chitin deacetylase (PgdA/CDA1 family)
MYLLPKPRHRRRRPYVVAGLLRLAVGSLLVAAVITAVVLVTGLPGRRHGARPVAGQSASPAGSHTPSPAGSDASSPHASPSLPAVHFVAHPEPVPILVYHHIRPARNGPRLLSISTSGFAAQLAYLRHRGYHPVTLQRVFDAWRGRATLPPHPIVLTFDDGYADQFRIAARRLHSYGWPAVLNVIVKNIDRRGPFRPSMVRHMIAWGWELDSHTITHRNLTRLPPAVVRHELVGSRTVLRHLFRVPVNFFSYPGGEYNSRLERAVARAGYLAATGTDYAAALPSERFALPRIYCYWGESLVVFGRRLRQTLSDAQRS